MSAAVAGSPAPDLCVCHREPMLGGGISVMPCETPPGSGWGALA